MQKKNNCDRLRKISNLILQKSSSIGNFGMIYLVYPGLGKTFLAKKDVGFCDINVRKFKDANFDNYTSSYRRTKIKNINPDSPNNLQHYLLDKIKLNIIILMAFKKATIQLLEEMELDYEIVLPDESKLEELKDTYKQRGDSDEYIEQNTTHRYKESLFLARQSGKVIRFVSKGFWLEDVIMEE